MKKNSNLKSGSFNPRIFLGFVLGSAGIFLALASVAMPNEAAPQAAATSGGARIYVTTTTQKIGGIGTGGCSLQEAIYSSTLHDTLDGGAHGIAIDATDADHFITTECVMGTGNGDTIILPVNGVFELKGSLDDPTSLLGVDAYNYMGPTATPIIFSNMTIEAYGATLEWTGKGNSRLFAIGQATITTPHGVASGTGSVTLRNAYIKSFHVKGGDGAVGGGGGGLGAGGAIYLQGGTLIIETSTFDSNSAVGGNAPNLGGSGGGGGGLGGNGGQNVSSPDGGGGGGGGGARGNGGNARLLANGTNAGGGGGTVFAGGAGRSTANNGGSGGFLCGGGGGGFAANGHSGSCAGGGGGGGGSNNSCFGNGDGGSGAYGGGGGGGAANGGTGGFGGGGGGGDGDGCGGNGGAGGFGGGGGFGQSFGGPGPGPGGPFGGNGGSGGSGGGGGGGALGGAIFNDRGSITVHNSTFTNNSVTRGVGANNGGDAGGAIFSRDGSLTLVNVTIANNQSTGSGGGVVAYSDSSASFILQDTILANNGANECFFTGNVSVSGVGNLVMQNGSGSQPFGACPGVVTTADPQLSTLQPPSVTGKYTPTMEIPLYSSAMGVADPATSLPYDQRFADRPQPDSQGRNGYDIGAFTVCRRYLVGLRYWSCSETHITPPPTTTLTMQALPSSEGTTNPAPGTYNEDQNSVVAIQAIPNSGYHFTGWTGNVAQPSNPSTTVTMSQAQTVTANFDVGSASADLQITVNDGKTATIAGATNSYTIVVSNGGPSYVTGAVVKDTFPSTFTGVTFTASATGGATGFPPSGSGNINNTLTLPPGSAVTYKATGKLNPAATGTLSDTATVTVPSGITDPNLANNSATDTDNITISSDLSVTVTDGKASAVAGSQDTYTIVVKNSGPSKVAGAVVHDAFPSAFTGVTYTATAANGATGFTASGSGNINNTVTMPAGSSITYKATGTISASATGSISDTATVTAPTGVTDPNTANNSATDTDTL